MNSSQEPTKKIWTVTISEQKRSNFKSDPIPKDYFRGIYSGEATQYESQKSKEEARLSIVSSFATYPVDIS